MSVLQTIPDVKIPYPSEGVIRTAQLDDTVAPENSVQLAVNMNFDRVGAVQTRLGVTSYADDIVEQINNYGTLRNAIVPAGYEFLYQVGETGEISTDFEDPAAIKISDTRIAIFWNGPDGDGFAQLFELDMDSGALTAFGELLEFDTGSAGAISAILLSSSRALAVWRGVSGDAFAQAFIVNTDDITPIGSPLEFDTSDGQDFTLALIDSSHVICFYTSGSDGIATVLAIDGGGAVTEPGAPLTFQSGSNFGTNSCQALGDGIHFMNVWTNGSGGQARVFTVNTGTWAITGNGTALTFDATGFRAKLVSCGDGSHFVTAYQGAIGRFEAQTLAVNLGTFAVTEVGTSVQVSPTSGNDLNIVNLDGNHFVAFYTRNIGIGEVQMFEMDLTTFNLSLVGDAIEGYDFSGDPNLFALNLATNKVMAIWGNDDDTPLGKNAMFQSFGNVVEGRWLYAAHGDEISNTPAPGGAWTSRRSGLATVSKPRFSQYLNYIWMVNGNEFIGGDPVATSNGGAFGTDLVPDNFPAGDFIHAGFEGRVWVANKTLGIIYYTDIVQFLPPSIYTLTYNPEVNFITTISPQTGESFTALYRVPRSLLVFTENNIYRIYGATSLDAYPAYNVGTFSQESIVETKTGIFFHHSSGFYQFDYGSQPVEISRRIIDFVQAIPRANYDDIVGVYDGFDAIEWSVGQVTVEGVVFSSCVLRYTISTQVWTIYDYVGNQITAMIFFDDGVEISHLMGTAAGKTGAMDVGTTDFGSAFYYEYIDRWRGYTDMYYVTKQASGFNVYSENAAGAVLKYQPQKAGPNAWQDLGTVTEKNNALLPNSNTEDFDVMRLRLVGNTKGTQVVVHGIEITAITIKGQEQN